MNTQENHKNTLYSTIKALQSAQGTNAKLSILEANKHDTLLRDYLKAVYDPSINYFQAKIPKHGPPSGRQQQFDEEDIEHALRVFAGRMVTGNDAIAALKKWLEDQNSTEDQELIKMLISRSINAGIADTIILKVWPKLWSKPAYMRCSLLDSKAKERFGKMRAFIVQTKADGSYASAINGWELSECSLVTRQGNKYPQWFADKMCVEVPQCSVAIGELEVYKDGSLLDRKTGNGVLSSVMQSNSEDEFVAFDFKHRCWDQLTLKEWEVGKSPRKYSARLLDLKWWYEDIIPTWNVKTLEEAYAIYSQHTSKGLEGVVLKNPNGTFSNGTSKDCVKLKLKFSCDYAIIGYYEGEGKYKGMLGGLTVATSCGKLVTNVGTGLSDKQRREFWTIREELAGKIVEVSANDVITSREKSTISLSLPAFEEIRTDKNVADSLDMVYNQLNSTKQGN